MHLSSDSPHLDRTMCSTRAMLYTWYGVLPRWVTLQFKYFWILYGLDGVSYTGALMAHRLASTLLFSSPHLMPTLTKRCTGGLATSEDDTHPPSQRRKVMENNGNGTAAGSKVRRLILSAFLFFRTLLCPPLLMLLLLH